MTKRFSLTELRNNQDFQSVLVRFALWGIASLHTFISHGLGHLVGDFEYYLGAIVFYLFIFIGNLISVLLRPEWPARRYVAMAIDISAVTTAFYPAGEAINPLALVYLWLVVAYGARYGRRHLFYAAAGSAAAYISVAIAQGLFIIEPTETVFFLIFLLVLPLYQYMIISGRIAAEQATEVKNRFLSTMTHELRTPLSGVIGMSRLLEATRLDNEQREYLKSIRTASSVLMSLIGDILDFSKIEANRLEIDKAPFNIHECVGVVCQSMSNRAEEKQLELICRIDVGVPTILKSDEIRIKQILYNLIGNAVKFTEQGEVEVRMSTTAASSTQAGKLQINIRDTGSGIAADKLPQIFADFWQENLSVTRKHGGTGLGTTISRELARMMGGDVDVSSTPGVGTTFRLLLPLESWADTAAQDKSNIFSGRTFLVIEANETSYGTISNTLTAAGADVLSAADQQDRHSIDMIILADSLTGVNLGALVQSQIEIFGPKVPMLILGYASTRYDLALPKWSFLTKPFIPQHLCEAISNLLVIVPGDRFTVHPESGATIPLHAQRPAKILVAEDEPINAKLISVLLSKGGHDATLVENGVKALELLSERSFDLAILDVRMPEMGGIEVTRQLRSMENKSGRHLPVVALTASAINEVKEECLSAGMDEFLLKPINPVLLDGLIERFAKHRVSSGKHISDWLSE